MNKYLIILFLGAYFEYSLFSWPIIKKKKQCEFGNSIAYFYFK